MPIENTSFSKKSDNNEKSKVKLKNNATAQKFEEIKNRNTENVKKLVEGYESSSDEEELDEGNILDKLYKNYKDNASGQQQQLLSKTSSFLENVLQSGAATCLICIASVKRADEIWSCRHCFCFFHLNCIKRWANDSIAQVKSNQHSDQGYYNNLGTYISPKKPKSPKWCCPQCRTDYEPNQRPLNYECFCGKELNPAQQAWLVPHSCGEICGKNLVPECGHKCLLLCHPGPCPPCPQNVYTSCKCGKSKAKSVRCFQKTWTCEEKCTKLLSCQKHRCGQICHEQEKCPPCNRTSKQKCICKSEESIRKCSELLWQCKNICNRKHACGIHFCKRICHSDPCGECPLGFQRFCPCGKTKKIGPCDETIDSCGDTCQKKLPCGLHFCTQRCHKGDCSLCLIITKKMCRCGKHEKELPCWKSFTCETKCKQMRECGKHACNKKCCDGLCPPCDKVCGKSLSCKKHKCKSICHDGPCYPCELTSQINCRCGSTTKKVPCGSERTARVTCNEPCRIPSKCHHSNRHRCHKNECPPCNQKCGLVNDFSGCGHLCEAKCHAAVKTFLNASAQKKTVWDYNSKNFELNKLPHPQCEVKVMVTCIGGHENAEWPCWNSKPTSCQRPCNRFLKCGWHKCEKVCHSVLDKSNMQEQDGCASCTKGCTIPRPQGCTHPCQRACHTPPCQPCNAIIKTKCHCGLNQVVFLCSEYNSKDVASEDLAIIQQSKLSCGGRCVKNYPCDHRCTMICHAGKCLNSDMCRRKVRIFCACKRIKIEISCDKYRTGFQTLPCDEYCEQTRAITEELKKQESEKQKLLEEEKDRIELEQYQKLFAKKKYKERKVATEKTKKNLNWKLISIYIGIAFAMLIAVGVALYEGN